MSDDLRDAAYAQGRQLGNTWATAVAVAGARFQGMIDAINERAAEMRAAEAAKRDEPVNGSTEDETAKDEDEIDPFYAYPFSQTFRTSIVNDLGGRVIWVPNDVYSRFPVGLPVTVYGPTPEPPEEVADPIRVRAGTNQLARGRTIIFVDSDKIPPGSLVEVRLLEGLQ